MKVRLKEKNNEYEFLTKKDTRFLGVRILNQKGFWDILIKDGIFESITKSLKHNGGILTPKLADIHVHLDKTGTAKRIGKRAGTLFEAIDLMEKDKVNWNENDIYNRASKALNIAWEQGTGFIRTHIDWTTPEVPIAWHVIKELRVEWRGKIEIQLASLCPLDMLAEEVKKIAKIVKADNAILGGFIFRNFRLREKLKLVFEAAKKNDIELDFHIDEGLDKQANGFDTVIDLVKKFNMKNRVLCSHCCSLSIRENSKVSTVLKMAAETGVGLTCLPTTNLWLQDNAIGKTPRYRGLAPIMEAKDEGIPIMIASDNCEDAFYPFGNYNQISNFSIAVLAAQLDERLWFDSISSIPANWMGAENKINKGSEANFLWYQANSLDELINKTEYKFEIWQKGRFIK